MAVNDKVFAVGCSGLSILYSDGGAGGSAASSESTNGTDGETALCGSAASGGGGGGGGGRGGSGGTGGNGAGGGVLLSNESGTISISGTIDASGGGSSTTNGGTVKVFYTGSAPSTAGITSGRTYTQSPNAVPAAPTLSAPSSGATGVSTIPQFQLRTTDEDSDYLRYEIIIYQSDCSTIVRTIDQTSSQTGWIAQDSQFSTAYLGDADIDSSTLAKHNYQPPALSHSTTYCWKGRAKDPGGSDTWSSYSATQNFTTVAAGAVPAAPTLISPENTITRVRGFPIFQLRSTDTNSDYLQYKIEVCANSDCSSIARTIDQTSSQTGWVNQDQNGNTAYTGSSTLGSSTIGVHTLQNTGLTANTQYWWRAYAIDPGGSNTFSSASSIQSFTTSPVVDINIRGGSTLRGGAKVN